MLMLMFVLRHCEKTQHLRLRADFPRPLVDERVSLCHLAEPKVAPGSVQLQLASVLQFCPSLPRQRSININQAFVQACFVLVETSDKDAMSKASAGGCCPLEEQVRHSA